MSRVLRIDGPATRGSVETWLSVFAIILAGVLVYHNSFMCPFLFDDEEAIVENPHIRHLRPLMDALSAPPQSAVAGRPVVSLSLAINYHFGRLNPWGYHAFNLAVHILAGLALFGIIRRSLLRVHRKTLVARASRPCIHRRDGGATTGLAAAAALIWVMHPLQTESVTYIVQRCESLMGLFYLLTLYCAIRGAASQPRSPRPTEPACVKPVFPPGETSASNCVRWPAGWHVAAVVACALGMATKEVMVTAPLLVLLYDRAFLSDSFREAFRRRVGLYVGLAATWIILGALVAMGPRSASAGFGLEAMTPLDYAGTQFGVILHYLKLTFWPAALCLDYDWPLAESAWGILPPMLVILMLVAITLWAMVRRPSAGYLGAWFFLILAPSSSIVPIADPAFEHRMYLPLAAVSVLVVVGTYLMLGKLGRTTGVSDRIRRGITMLSAVLIMAALGTLTVRRNHDYRSAYAMWRDVIAKRPYNHRAHNNLAKALHTQGELDEAIEHYRASLRLSPRYATAYNNLGVALAAQGNTFEAVEHYEQALRIQPDWAEAHNNLGLALAQRGRLEDAADSYRRAIDAKPSYADAHYNLANTLLRMGRTDLAIEHYNKALQYRPDYLDAHCNLATALMSQEKTTQAQRHYAAALRIAFRLGDEFRAQGNIDAAAAVHRKAVQIDPNSAKAHYLLGLDLADLGQMTEAVEQYRKALRIAPGHAAAQRGLDAVLGRHPGSTAP